MKRLSFPLGLSCGANSPTCETLTAKRPGPPLCARLGWGPLEVPTLAFHASQERGYGLGPSACHLPEELLWPAGRLDGAGVRDRRSRWLWGGRVASSALPAQKST